MIHNGTMQTFDANQVKRIRADLGAGNDVFAVHGSLGKRITVLGGAGR